MVKKILVVDDESVLAETIGYNLRREGYAAFAAHDGQEALQVARGEKPDAIILDVMVPKLDGFDVCCTLRHAPRGLESPIIPFTCGGPTWSPRSPGVPKSLSRGSRAESPTIRASTYPVHPVNTLPLSGLRRG